MTRAEAERIARTLYAVTGEMITVEQVLAAHNPPAEAPLQPERTLGPDE